MCLAYGGSPQAPAHRLRLGRCVHMATVSSGLGAARHIIPNHHVFNFFTHRSSTESYNRRLDALNETSPSHSHFSAHRSPTQPYRQRLSSRGARRATRRSGFQVDTKRRDCFGAHAPRNVTVSFFCDFKAQLEIRVQKSRKLNALKCGDGCCKEHQALGRW